MTDLATRKSDLRKQAFAVRKAAHASADNAGGALRDHLLAGRYHTGALIVAGYRPIRTEIDPTPLMHALHSAGHRIAVPVILGPDQALEFREWWPDVPMQEGAFGAQTPVDTQVLTPDLVLVPLVAFDAQGWRLGYGGGFYDRSLEGLRAERKTLAIGLAYAAQQVDAVPREPTDQPLDAVVTERGLMPIGRQSRP
ncbi:MAG: 5-formyltetrahydrofolate cyclo-ligase [Pseudomonadota bacterium]